MRSQRQFVLVLGSGLVLLAAVAAGYWAFRRAVDFPGPRMGIRGTRMTRIGPLLDGQHTREIDLDLSLLPEDGRIRAEALVKVESRSGPRQTFVFLLNTGLAVTSVAADDLPVSTTHRGGVLTVTAGEPVPEGRIVTLAIRYEGAVAPLPFAEATVSHDETILPMLSFWYPCDLQSFSMRRYRLTLPEDMTVVTAGRSSIEPVSQGFHAVEWAETRPTIGATLVAGGFKRASRIHGDAVCAVYWPQDVPFDPTWLLTTSGVARNALVSLYGGDGFDSLAVVLSAGMSESGRHAFHGGNAVMVAPVTLFMSDTDAHDDPSRFVAVARLVARNWWGGTVAGRWLTDKPEGAAWLVESLAEHGARAALQKAHGRRAGLRYLENVRGPKALSLPMKTVALLEDSPQGDASAAVARTYGPQVVGMLENRIGRQAFGDACRNLLAIHRFSTVSFAAFRQELELASEQDLGEFFHAWFDRTGAFDYAIAKVDEADGRVRIAIANRGDFPAMTPMRLAVHTGNHLDFHTVEPGAQGGTFSLPVRGPVMRIALDPEFVTPDYARANNVWPRQTWPLGVTACADGTPAWWALREWCDSDQVTMTVHRDDSLVQAKLVSGLAEAPLWSPAGASLAWLTDPASGAADAVFVWSLGAHPAKLTASSVDRLAGWLDGNRLAGFVAGSAPKWRVIPIDRSRGTAGSLQRAPGRVVSPPNPRTGVIAYVPSPPEAWSIPARGIRLLDVSSGDDRLVVPEAEPYWTLCWTADGAALVFFDRSGRLFRAEPDLPLGAPLLETSHRVRRPRFSHGGGKVAWVDPGGSVRLADVDTRTRRQVNLPETPIAFAWEGERALLCLTASTETPLPMLYHATYALYRVPVDTLEPVRLPINPSRAN